MKITRAINQSKLMDELLNLDLITPLKPDGTTSLQGNELYIENEENLTQIEQIIDAHDPTPLPLPKTEYELLQDRLKATEDALLVIMDIQMGGV